MGFLNGLKNKIFILISISLIVLGISFKIIFHPVYLDAPGVDGADAAQKEIEFAESGLLEDESYILPIAKVSIPFKKAGAADIAISARSVLAVDDFTGEILYGKDAGKKVKIASLTKLATAGTIYDLVEKEKTVQRQEGEKYGLDRVVTISKFAISAEGSSGYLTAGEKIKAKDLVKIMLIASSNDAARALAEDITKYNNKNSKGYGYFVGLMNEYVKREGLQDTYFTNPDGLDEKENFSTASDIVKLSGRILRDHPEIFEITRTENANILSEEGNEHNIKNTNKLLGSLPGIVGGKTGYTDKAGESLLLVVRDPTDEHQIIAAVTGADGRFAEMEKLTKWIWESYEWK